MAVDFRFVTGRHGGTDVLVDNEEFYVWNIDTQGDGK